MVTLGDARPADAARLEVLTAVLDGLPAQVCAWDTDLRLRWANLPAQSWGGLDRAEAQGRTLAEVLGADVADLIRPYFLAALDGRRVRYERVASDVDRHRRSFLVDVTPLLVRGQVVGVSSFGVEISGIDDAAARIGARSPLLDERDRVGEALEAEVLPRLRDVMRVLADAPRRPSGPRDTSSLEQVIAGIDSTVIRIRDGIRDLRLGEPPPPDDLPVVPGPGLVRIAMPDVEAPVPPEGVDWSLEHARVLFDSLPPSGAWDRTLTNVTLNQPAATGFGYDSPAQVEGLAYRSVVGEAMARRSEGPMRRALRGTPVEIVVAFVDPRGLRRSGRMRYTPFRSPDGRPMVSAMVVQYDADSLDEPITPAAAAAGLAEDRRRIAEDLHDHVIQLLYAAGLSVASVVRRPEDADAATALGNATQCVADALLAIHSVAGALTRTDPLETEETIRRVVRRSVAALGFEPQVDLVGDPNALPPDVVADLTAVLREALSNVARHAHAGVVRVALVTGRDDARLRVADDGVGIGSPVRSSGLTNIAARAERHGGAVTVRDGEPGGTVLDWRVPL